MKRAIDLLNEAAELVKGITTVKFNASVDLHIRLGVDPRNADQLVSIPMKGSIASLNVSVAAGIILFEMIRQRGT